MNLWRRYSYYLLFTALHKNFPIHSSKNTNKSQQIKKNDFYIWARANSGYFIEHSHILFVFFHDVITIFFLFSPFPNLITTVVFLSSDVCDDSAFSKVDVSPFFGTKTYERSLLEIPAASSTGGAGGAGDVVDAGVAGVAGGAGDGAVNDKFRTDDIDGKVISAWIHGGKGVDADCVNCVCNEVMTFRSSPINSSFASSLVLSVGSLGL